MIISILQIMENTKKLYFIQKIKEIYDIDIDLEKFESEVEKKIFIAELDKKDWQGEKVDFFKELIQRIKLDERDYDFQNYFFPKISFDGEDGQGQIFEGDVSFEGSKFLNDVHFGYQNFLGIDIYDTDIKIGFGYKYIDESIDRKKKNFFSSFPSILNGDVNFYGTEFFGNVSFENIEFNGNVDFSNIKIHFLQIGHTLLPSFLNVRFKKILNIDNIYFNDKNKVIGDTLCFLNSEFLGKIILGKSFSLKEINFISSRINGDIFFDGYKGIIKFNDTTFKRNIKFIGFDKIKNLNVLSSNIYDVDFGKYDFLYEDITFISEKNLLNRKIDSQKEYKENKINQEKFFKEISGVNKNFDFPNYIEEIYPEYSKYKKKESLDIARDYESLQKIYSEFKKKFEKKGQRRVADRFYSKEMDIRLKKLKLLGIKGRPERILLFIYLIISNYGQEFSRTVAWIFGITFLLGPILIYIFGNVDFQNYRNALLLSIRAFSFQKDDGFQDLQFGTKWVITVLFVLSPILLSVLVLAIKRRFKR